LVSGSEKKKPVSRVVLGGQPRPIARKPPTKKTILNPTGAIPTDAIAITNFPL